ncbi:uncharacterized protein LOC110238241 isoform X2 [Exaiptasia diaphana]|uniref:Tumor protein p53-inducible protein 11 n=1 Tax=Exaiptasia diaphana TaxID=2652724 RepID=A0A913X640_EXADI|nr:uncharacterized protein LOC110238241 isoform X2 [Exaiptasia diaphana]
MASEESRKPTLLHTDKRSFDDAQSRFKCRKVLGIGGKEPSKVLQVLGRHESYLLVIPRGYETWQTVIGSTLFLFGVVWLVFPGVWLSLVGSQTDPVIGNMSCRIIAGALFGIVAITWYTEPSSMQSLRNILMLQYIYNGVATFSMTWAFMTNKSKILLCLAIIHGFLTIGSVFYYFAFREMNKPTPDKPYSKSMDDKNHID